MSESFTVFPGGPASPFILHVPHSSRAIPADVRGGMCATDAQLAAELDEITDDATDLIAVRTVARAAELLADGESAATSHATPWIFRNNLSRLVVDPERFPDEREELNAVGRGAVYMKLCDGSDLRGPAAFGAADAGALMDRFYHPYAAAMAEMTRRRIAAAGAAFIVDVHSYPERKSAYELHDGPRPEICLGINYPEEPGTPDWSDAPDGPRGRGGSGNPGGQGGPGGSGNPDGQGGPDGPGASVGKQGMERFEARYLEHLATAVFERAGFDVAVNTPFAGTYIPLEFAADSRVGGIMIEVRKDVYLHDADTDAAADADDAVDTDDSDYANEVDGPGGAPRPNHGAIERIAGCIAEVIVGLR